MHFTVWPYLSALLWGALILVSMCGWGGALCRAVRFSRAVSWAENATIGFALSMFIGGVLNFAGAISRGRVATFLIMGAVLWAVVLVRRRMAPVPSRDLLRLDWISLAGFGGVALLLLIRVAGSAVMLHSDPMFPGSFNPFDDYQGYFVHPEKMVQRGSMGPDPFNLRQMPSISLGGAAFLKTFVLAALSEQNLHLVDVGIGTILILGLLWEYLRRVGASLASIALVLAVFLLLPTPIANTSSLLLPIALFLGLSLLFREAPEGRLPLSRALLIGLEAAAMFSLKSTMIPACACFLAVTYGLAVLHAKGKQNMIREAAWVSVFAVLFVLPWIMDGYRRTGKIFSHNLNDSYAHPDLIAAYDKVVDWRRFPQHLRDLKHGPYLILSGLALLGFAASAFRREDRDILIGLFAAAVVGTFAILMVAGSLNNVYRYAYPFVTSALLLSLVQFAAAERKPLTTDAHAVLLIAGVMIGFLVFSGNQEADQTRRGLLAVTNRALHEEKLIPPLLSEKYRKMQESLPAGSVVLARLERPFLLNFRRNQIFVVDPPGYASASPGMPYFHGAEPVARYLLSHSIRYVAYDYATEAGLPETGFFAAMARDDRYPVAQAVVRLTFDLHHNLAALGSTRQRVYDDGTTFVIDLLDRRAGVQ